MTHRYGVLDCEDLDKWRGYDRVWTRAMQCEGDHWESFRCYKGELPNVAELPAFAGFVITGSHHDATSSETWVKELAGFLKTVVRRGGIRVLGGCFGCQLLALALGGEVGRNPSGQFCIGVESVTPNKSLLSRADYKHALALATSSPSISSGGAMRVMVSHFDQVTKLPPGAELLASSPSANVEAWSLGDNVLAWQSHPELAPAHLEEKILPAQVEKGRVTKQGAEAVLEAVHGALDAAVLIAAGRHFLSGGQCSDTEESIKACMEAAYRALEEADEEYVTAAAARELLARSDAKQGASSGAGASSSGSNATFPADARAALQTSMQDMFGHVAKALTGELLATQNEYAVLGKMNTLAADKYAEMGDLAQGLGTFVQALRLKDDAFAPYLRQIDDIEAQVGELEGVVKTLDEHTKRLETRFIDVKRSAA
mmetsp:Transcript_28073/g.91763  ORF Transcript_28073/g.91763 Transcript_28073/m.91763 type:complete len:428 (-) Transcript_28073:73-1356(-)|eukprot:CAMPEP_0170145282 /NCGR_PEP_ID=MMETSP0033_2-20121228/16429_1 /TAXON_ID=195969 /ORGANISM="Dolichomastix tenuilepis, Strain CCMP3274" /LENGTH=427 /DNA_ID=CAMNT_0010381827 /DNA_START=189 /DNA_END=1472 /DNA_ORIENTATION=-